MNNKTSMHATILAGAVILATLSFPPTAPAGVLNLNTASKAELLSSTLDMNRTLIARLVEYREKHGPFKSVEDLMKVNGINSALVLRLGIYRDQQGNMVVEIPDDDIPEGMTVPLY